MGRKKGEQAEPQVGALFDRVVAIMDGARDRVVRQVNYEMLIAYWHIGREIVEQVQEGQGRAAYGREVLGELSKRLTERYGRGFSFTNLKYFRLFYKVYATRRPGIETLSGVDSGRIQRELITGLGSDGSPSDCHAPRQESEPGPQGASHNAEAESGSDQRKSSDKGGIEDHGAMGHTVCDPFRTDDLVPKKQTPCDPSGSRQDMGARPCECGEIRGESRDEEAWPDPFSGFAPLLGWSHYRVLTQVAHRAERHFYEIEANAQAWSVRQLERQIDSLLFARLLKSRDKAGLLELSTKGQVLESPMDALKDPYVLDFLDLPDSEVLHESDLEAAILHKLRAFLLELGKGFAFVAKQQRLAFEDEHFYVDLVFYNITLRCYLLIDLKVGKLTHQDIGQMDSYVRLFDDQCTSEDDNPTIGLILCAHKNEAIARYSVLRESEQIFAARYVQVLPSIEELQRELQQERRRLDQRQSR